MAPANPGGLVGARRRLHARSQGDGVLLIALGLIATGLGFAAIWIRPKAAATLFPKSDELVLRQIKAPLRALQASPRHANGSGAVCAGYGESWYYLDGRKTVSCIATAEGVLEAIYFIANVTPPAGNDEEIFRGHPLAVAPNGAGAIFYGVWPGLIVLRGILLRRRIG
jgi:hypothetical protein